MIRILLFLILISTAAFGQLATDSTINPFTGDIDKIGETGITDGTIYGSTYGWKKVGIDVTLYATGDNVGVGTDSPSSAAAITVSRDVGSIGTPTSPIANLVAGAGASNFLQPDTVQYRIWAYKTISGTRIYSSTYAQTNQVTIGTDGDTVQVSWGAVTGGEGYYVVQNLNGVGYDDYYADAGNITVFTDDNGFDVWYWNFGTPVTTPSTFSTSTYLNYGTATKAYSIYGNAEAYFGGNLYVGGSSQFAGNAAIGQAPSSTIKFSMTESNVAQTAVEVVRNGSTSLNPAALIVRNASGSANAGVTIEDGGPNNIGAMRMAGTRVSTGDYLGVFEFQDLSAAGDYRTAMIIGKAGTALGYGGMEFLTRNAGGFHYALALSEHGRVGINMLASAPTAWLHLPAGSTVNSTAPIKFTSGPLNTAPEIGALEFLTDKLNFTITTGTSRKEITLNDIALTSGRVPIVTTNGRLTDLSTMTYASSRLNPSYLTLTGGGTGAGTAPIKFTNGSVNASPEAHALEINNDDIYYTILTGTARKRFVLDDTTLVSGRVPYVTTNGRLTSSSAWTFDGTSETFGEGHNIVAGTSTGTKIGTATSQKLAFFNSTPIIQPVNTTAIDTTLVNLGLRASGGVANFGTVINTPSGSASAPSFSWSSSATTGFYLDNVDTIGVSAGNTEVFDIASTGLTFLDGKDITVENMDVTANGLGGIKIGTATSQRISFFNSTPVIQPTGNAITALTNLGLLATANPDATEFGYLDGVTSAIQTQLNNRSPNPTANSVPVSTGSAFIDSTIYIVGSNVGIGTTAPVAKMDVEGAIYLGRSGGSSTPTWVAVSLSGNTGDALINGDVEIDGALYVDGFIYGNGSKLTGISAGAETDPIVKAISGIVKSNGVTISAATAGADYLATVNHNNGLTGSGTTASPLLVDNTVYVQTSRTINSKALTGNIVLTSGDIDLALYALDTDLVIYTPQARTINNKALTSNITITSGDIDLALYALDTDLNGYVPTSRTVNSKSLSSNITLTSGDIDLALYALDTDLTIYTPQARTVNAKALTSNIVLNVQGDIDASIYALDSDISDTAYASSWNGVTTNANSKNAIYDILHVGDADDDGKADVVDLATAGLVRTTSGGVISADTTIYTPQARTVNSKALTSDIVLNIQDIDMSIYQLDLNGTGYVKAAGTVITYDATVYTPFDAELNAIAQLANSSGYLNNNGSGVFSYGSPSAGAGGSNQQIQYNSSGTLAGNVGMSFNSTDSSVYFGGNVGIGSITPKSKLQVDGAIYGRSGAGTPTWVAVSLASAGDMFIQGDTEIDSALYVDGFIYGNGTKLTGVCKTDGTNCPASGAFAITETEIDFGTTPVSEASFTITNGSITATMKVMATVSYAAPTAKDQDELEMDNLQLRAVAGTGDFTLYVTTDDGSYLADKFKINYTYQ